MKTGLLLSVLLTSGVASAQGATIIPIALETETGAQQIETVSFHFNKPYWFEITSTIDTCGPCRYDVSFAHVTMYASVEWWGYDDTGGIFYDHNYPGGWVPRTVRNIAPAGDFDLVVKALTWSDDGGVGVVDTTTTIRVWPTPEPSTLALTALGLIGACRRG